MISLALLAVHPSAVLVPGVCGMKLLRHLDRYLGNAALGLPPVGYRARHLGLLCGMAGHDSEYSKAYTEQNSVMTTTPALPSPPAKFREGALPLT